MKKPHKQSQQQQQSGAGGKPAEQPKASSVVVKETGGEPVVLRNSVPVLLIALLVALIYWGNMHIVEHGGQLDARVHSPYRSIVEIKNLKPRTPEEELMAKGLGVYMKVCASCHQNDGNGSTSQNAPPLAGSEWVLEKDPAKIIRIVLHGLSGPITVKGKEWGAGQMLAWKDVLTDDQDIAAVLTYIRNNRAWGNKAPAVNAGQVKKARDETKDHTGYMTVELLNQVPAK